MTTGTELGRPGGGSIALTRLPRPGSVLVRAAGQPAVPDAECADVRPGSFVVLDGDRRRGTLHVEWGADRRRVPTTDLDGLAAAVETALEAGASVVRFGDRASCRGHVPAPTVAAIERRLRATVVAHQATLLTWADEAPGDADRRTYDAVV